MGNSKRSNGVNTMSDARFSDFMDGESIASVMIQTPRPAVVTLPLGEMGTGIKPPADAAE